MVFNRTDLKTAEFKTIYRIKKYFKSGQVVVDNDFLCKHFT